MIETGDRYSRRPVGDQDIFSPIVLLETRNLSLCPEITREDS